MFLSVVIYYKYIQHYEPNDTKKESTVSVIKEQIEFVYIVLMSVLLMINFNPWTTVSIDMETRVLLFIYGIVILLTSKYSTFINQSILKSKQLPGSHQTQNTHPHSNNNNTDYLLS